MTPEAIVERVYESISAEEWEILQDCYNDSMDMLDELENLDVPIPRLSKRVRTLLELRRQSQKKEENGSDKQDQIQESD
jgi:hypothetical protein